MPEKGGTKVPGTVTPAEIATEDLGSFVTVAAEADHAASIADVVAQGAGTEQLSFDPADVEDQMVLSLSELLPDSKGEVVLFNEAGPLAVNIMTDSRVMETGTADHYVTSTGIDVSGYHFCTFEAGLTIYYPPEIDLLVTSGQV